MKKYQELDKAQTTAAELELAKIKVEVERIEYSVHIGDVLLDLRKDDRYKEVFDEYYLKTEVIRDAMLLSEKYFLEPDQRQSLQDGLIGKAHFNDWVKATVSMGALSASRLVEHMARIKELETLLSVGYPMEATKVITPPEGLPNVK